MKYDGLKRYHLMNGHYGDSTWRLVDLEKDHAGAWSNGKLTWSDFDDVYQGDTLEELCLNIYDAKDKRFYVTLDAMLHDGTWRFDTYPMHCELHILCGYVRTVYTRDKAGEWSYGYSFPGELWVREKGVGLYKWKETITKVEGFNMREERKDAIENYLKSVRENRREEADE